MLQPQLTANNYELLVSAVVDEICERLERILYSKSFNRVRHSSRCCTNRIAHYCIYYVRS